MAGAVHQETPGTTVQERLTINVLQRHLGSNPAVTFAIRFPSGSTVLFGKGQPSFELEICSRRGMRAVQTLDELRICEAYLDGEIDFVGSMRDAVALRWDLKEQNVWVSLWRRVEHLFIGLTKANEKWVQTHYDSNNIQLSFLDRDYQTYTPGVFEDEGESLETASERKHRLAFEGTGLKPGDRILDVGFGWGSFLRYAARRGVHVTGITLSRHQLEYVREEFVKKESLAADLLYTDFFKYAPAEQFDGIVALGVIEELADYHGILERIARWLKPGKRVYLDFMAMNQREGTFPAFISKYIYQGRTRRVYLPEFVEAVTTSPFEIAAIHNDRRNYYLTVTRWFERFEQQGHAIREKFGERMYRLFRMYMAGNPGMLSHPSHFTTAYRVFLELPADRVVGAGGA